MRIGNKNNNVFYKNQLTLCCEFGFVLTARLALTLRRWMTRSARVIKKNNVLLLAILLGRQATNFAETTKSAYEVHN